MIVIIQSGILICLKNVSHFVDGSIGKDEGII